MTREEFHDLLQARTDVQLLGLCLRDALTPYVFDSAPRKWDAFRDDLATAFGIVRTDITIVGSGRLGFSLKPNNSFRAFSDRSDIDVVVVSADLFDDLWLALLDAAYPRGTVRLRLADWLRDRRNEIYTGWLTPLAIKLDPSIWGAKARRVGDFNALWFNTLKKASRHPVRRHENINGRLYRSWAHAELYHLSSLADLRRSLSA